jgi:branched-chain amino acid transport system substrate-binding protein
VGGLENTVLAGADGMISPQFLGAAAEAAEGMYISGPDLAFQGDRYQNFKATYSEISGQKDPISAFHAHAYDAANMIFDAVEQVAKTDAEGNTLIGRQALRVALYALKDFDGITGKMTCAANGDCADPKIAVNQVQNGAYVPVFPESGAAEEAAPRWNCLTWMDAKSPSRWKTPICPSTTST